MDDITKRSKYEPNGPDTGGRPFSNVRHYIGRLGWHKKAAKVLVNYAERFSSLFADFEVKACPSPQPAEKPPQADQLTTLDGIVKRMLPKDDPRVHETQEALQFLDSKFKVHKRIMERYNDPWFLPRVHAELVLLEHFYTHDLRFFSQDKYIGCSKPACYCCYHYISAHPGNFVRPACHNKTYLNWRPPDIDDDDKQAVKHRRDIINAMLNVIRKDVIAQIKDRRGPNKDHHDSTTGISTSLFSRANRGLSDTFEVEHRDIRRRESYRGRKLDLFFEF